MKEIPAGGAAHAAGGALAAVAARPGWRSFPLGGNPWCHVSGRDAWHMGVDQINGPMNINRRRSAWEKETRRQELEVQTTNMRSTLTVWSR